MPSEYEDENEVAMPGGSWNDRPVWSPARKAEERRRRDYDYGMRTYDNPKVRSAMVSAYFGGTGLGAKELDKAIASIRASGAENVARISGEAQVESYKGYGKDASQFDTEAKMAELEKQRGGGGVSIADAGRSRQTSDVALPGHTATQIIDQSNKPAAPPVSPTKTSLLQNWFESSSFADEPDIASISKKQKKRKEKSTAFRLLHPELYE